MNREVAAPPALDEALLHSLAEHGGVRHYAARTVIISEGDSSDALFVIVSGRVKVYASSRDGKEVVIATHGPGEYVGELALDGEIRSASVMTLEPTTCSVVSGAKLRQIIASHPDLALHLIRKLIWRVRQATDSVKSLALDDVYARVVRLLHDSSVAEGDVRVVADRMTQQDIADRVGASREMVSRIFKDLATGEYIAIERHRITILTKPPTAW